MGFEVELGSRRGCEFILAGFMLSVLLQIHFRIPIRIHIGITDHEHKDYILGFMAYVSRVFWRKSFWAITVNPRTYHARIA